MEARKTVIIVGVGALGSHVAQFLRNEAELRVIDFDRVESRNTLAQFHGKTGTGKLKTQNLQQAMQLLWGIKIGSNTNKLVADNVDVLLHGSDLIIDCLDNGEARRLVQTFARTRYKSSANGPTPCLHGALAANGGFGRVIWDEHFVIDEADAGVPTCEDGAHLPMIAITSAYLARAAQVFLRTGKRIGFQVSPGGAVVV